ncbi:MAG: YigZ family protein [Wenzhouxiangellaceae bacterium]
MNRICRIGRCEQTIKNSRFIGVCGPADNEPAAQEFIRTHGEAGCRHVCFAYRCGDLVRFDDAGEPGGTAGRPMLAALEHFELDRSIVVVSRFFGGVKLGTGGLARAYGGTAMEAIANAVIEPIIETIVLECRVPFESAGDLHQLAERHDAEKRGEEWNENGLRLELEIPRETADTLINELTAITRGESSVKRTD